MEVRIMGKKKIEKNVDKLIGDLLVLDKKHIQKVIDTKNSMDVIGFIVPELN